MKLLRYGPKGQEKPGMIDAQGRHPDLVGQDRRYRWQHDQRRSLARLQAIERRACRWSKAARGSGPASAGIGKFVCIGLNYADHAAEIGTRGAARAGHLHEGDQRHLRPERRRRDPARLGERPTGRSSSASSSASTPKYVAEAEALEHIAGYCVVNDVSERAFQAERSGPVDQGQEPRHLRPDRPLAGHPRRGAGAPEADDVARGRRASATRTARPRPWSTRCRSWSATCRSS